MFIKYSKLRIGPRTLKTAFAVTLSIVMVSFYGSSTSNLIFATIGALSAMGATFKESLESCFSQIAGVLFGVFAGVLLLSFHMHPLLASGIGIIIVITFYNLLRLKISPTLACIVVVTICNLTSTTPFIYAIERIWDTAIGLFIGMLINLFIFPYDNSKQIRNTIHRLDRELILYLEDMFDGDEILPDATVMTQKVDAMYNQMRVFSNQKLLLHLRRQKEKQELFHQCELKARVLLARIEVLSQMGTPGCLSEENRQALTACGATILDNRSLCEPTERDIVMNYHIRQVLLLRQELLDVLNQTE